MAVLTKRKNISKSKSKTMSKSRKHINKSRKNGNKTRQMRGGALARGPRPSMKKIPKGEGAVAALRTKFESPATVAPATSSGLFSAAIKQVQRSQAFSPAAPAAPVAPAAPLQQFVGVVGDVKTQVNPGLNTSRLFRY